MLKLRAILSAFFFGGCGVGDPPLEEIYVPANAPLTIDITGDDYDWHIRYPGRDGQLHTADDIEAVQDVYLPENVEIQIRLHSEDYIYVFAIPELELNQVAIPDMEFSLAFETGAVDTFVFRGRQLCGFVHKSLRGKMVVESKRAFAARLEEVRINAK